MASPVPSRQQPPPASGQKPAASTSPKSASNRDEAKERDVLANLIAHVSPTTCRSVIQEYVSKCVAGRDDHVVTVIREVLKGLQGSDVSAKAKRELLSLFSRRDLDFLGDILIRRASNRLLDLCTEERVRTMDGQRLLNMLADHERIGFRKSDQSFENIGDDGRDDGDDGDDGDHRNGLHHTAVMPPTPMSASAPGLPGSLNVCVWCKGVCADETALKFHLAKTICTQRQYDAAVHPVRCSRCLHPFGNAKALAYHMNNRVCSMPLQPSMISTTGLAPDSPLFGAGANSPAFAPMPFQPSKFAATQTPQAHMYQQNQRGRHPQHHQYQAPGPSATRTPRARHPPQTPQTPSSSQPPAKRFNSLNDPDDPNGALTPAELARMKEELDEARSHYAGQIAQAKHSPLGTPHETDARIGGFRNSLNTKQSMIRKRYGIRLRGPRDPKHLMREREKLSQAIARAEAMRGYSAKRMRTDTHGNGVATTSYPASQPDLAHKPASSPAMVANGLLPATNVPRATVDPTTLQPPGFSSSMPPMPPSHRPPQPAPPSTAPLPASYPMPATQAPPPHPRRSPGTPSGARASMGTSTSPIELDASSSGSGGGGGRLSIGAPA